MQSLEVMLKKGEILCREGDKNSDLFLLDRGELMICVRNGTQITAVAIVGAGEFIGELSFFDNSPRSADVVATQDSRLIQISSLEIKTRIPTWLSDVSRGLTYKIRLMDEAVRKKGVRKSKAETIRPLSIEEQRFYYEILTKQNKK